MIHRCFFTARHWVSLFSVRVCWPIVHLSRPRLLSRPLLRTRAQPRGRLLSLAARLRPALGFSGAAAS